MTAAAERIEEHLKAKLMSEVRLPQGVTAAELQDMKFEPVRYIVDRYVAEGLTILAGKPKIGKSWLALNIALVVPQGGIALGGRQCAKGPVLYAALEDTRRRLQSRLRKIQEPTRINGGPRVSHCGRLAR